MKNFQAKLTERQLELLSRVEVTGDLAQYLGSQIADWPQLKKVMLALGGSWSRGKKGFLFDVGGEELEQRIGYALATGEVLDPKLAGFFPTPEGLAEQLVRQADLKAGEKVLEPSAGQGGIADVIKRLAPEVQISLYEILPDNVRVLKEKGYAIIAAFDFMIQVKRPVYDAVIMNPPFSKGEDVRHVTHALEFLKPGGRLLAIMSAGVEFRSDKKTTAFREAIKTQYRGTISRLPEKSFHVSGTDVRTVLVTAFA